jgi:hypothetical protein
VVAGDGRVVDVHGAEVGDAAANADAEQVGRPGLAGGGDSVEAEGGNSASGGGAAPGASLPAGSGQGLIGRDDVVGLGLLGPLLRPQPRLEREGAGGRVEDPAADAADALAAG